MARVTPSSAGLGLPAKCLRMSRACATGTSSGAMTRPIREHVYRDRLALPEGVVRVHDDDPQSVDEVGAQVAGLDGLGRELGGGRDEADGAVIGAGIAIGGDLHRHAGGDATEVALIHVRADAHRPVDREGEHRLARLHDRAGLARSGEDDARTRRVQHRVRDVRARPVALRNRLSALRLGGVDILDAGARALERKRLLGCRHLSLAGLVVRTCRFQERPADGAAVDELRASLEVGTGANEIRLLLPQVRRRLPDVLRAIAVALPLELRGRGGDLRLVGGQLVAQRAIIQRREHRARLDVRPLLEGDADQAAAQAEPKVHLANVDVAVQHERLRTALLEHTEALGRETRDDQDGQRAQDDQLPALHAAPWARSRQIASVWATTILRIRSVSCSPTRRHPVTRISIALATRKTITCPSKATLRTLSSSAVGPGPAMRLRKPCIFSSCGCMAPSNSSRNAGVGSICSRTTNRAMGATSSRIMIEAKSPMSCSNPARG